MPGNRLFRAFLGNVQRCFALRAKPSSIYGSSTDDAVQLFLDVVPRHQKALPQKVDDDVCRHACGLGDFWNARPRVIVQVPLDLGVLLFFLSQSIAANPNSGVDK